MLRLEGYVKYSSKRQIGGFYEVLSTFGSEMSKWIEKLVYEYIWIEKYSLEYLMKRYLFSAYFLIALIIILLCLIEDQGKDSVETFNIDSVTSDEIKDEIIVAMFIENIRKHVENFYSEYYSGEIEIYNYETVILEVEKPGNGFISIKFGVTPQIGAHNPIGYDELLYYIDSLGNGKMTKYEHIRNYTIPEKFEKYIIKPLEWL